MWVFNWFVCVRVLLGLGSFFVFCFARVFKSFEGFARVSWFCLGFLWLDLMVCFVVLLFPGLSCDWDLLASLNGLLVFFVLLENNVMA